MVRRKKGKRSTVSPPAPAPEAAAPAPADVPKPPPAEAPASPAEPALPARLPPPAEPVPEPVPAAAADPAPAPEAAESEPAVVKRHKKGKRAVVPTASRSWPPQSLQQRRAATAARAASKLREHRAAVAVAAASARAHSGDHGSTIAARRHPATAARRAPDLRAAALRRTPSGPGGPRPYVAADGTVMVPVILS